VAGRILSLLCFLLAALAWPAVLGNFVELRWQIADLRPGFALVSLCAAVAGALALRRRERVDAWLARSFASPRRVALGALSLVLSLALSLAAAELALAALGLPFRVVKTPSEFALAQFDAERGWAYVPGRSSVQKFGSDQREIPLYFDARGARVPAPEAARDPGRPSLLLVGCSYAMGHGVRYEDSLAGRLEAAPGFPLQVVNLGVQAYGTDQALLALRGALAEFDAKVVVYPFICDHVARNANSDRRILRPTRRFLGTKPRFALDSDGRPYLSEPAHEYSAEWQSRLWAMLQIRLAGWGPPPSLELTRALVSEMKRETEARGAKLVVVQWQMDSAPPYCGEHPLDGLDLALIDTSRDAPPGWNDWKIPGDGHPDPRAHERVAALVLDELRELEVLP
jgi:hypothetical protein